MYYIINKYFFYLFIKVIKGYKTEREVFKDFVKNWNKGSADREITFDEFYEYYMVNLFYINK